MSSILLLLSALLLQLQVTATPMYSESTEYLIRHYTIDDGLPVNAVNGIVQDSDRYLFFSTYDGLVKYDGYTFNVYNSGNTPEISTNRFAGILQASDGTLWLTNEGGTVTIKRGASFHTFSKSELPGLVSQVIEDSNGGIWAVGTSGLFYYSDTDSAFKRIDHTGLQAPFNVFAPGKDGELYAVTARGVHAVRKDASTLLIAEKELTISINQIWNLQQINDDQLWIIGLQGASLFNINEGKTEQTLYRNGADVTRTLFINQQNSRQILTTDSGFYVLGDNNQPYRKLDIPFSPEEVSLRVYLEGKQGEEILIGYDTVIIDGQVVLEDPLVKTVTVDNEGSLWIGSNSKGLYQIRKSNFVNISTQEIPGFINIYSIVEDRMNEIWACSFTTGIYNLHSEGYRFWNSTNSSLKNDLCKFIYEDVNGTIYASMNDGGLWRYQQGDWKYIHELAPIINGYDGIIEAMHRQGDKLFISNFNSLAVLENERVRFFDESRPRELSGIQVFRENKQGVIFAGTERHGISRIEGNTFRNYTSEQGVLNSNIIRDLLLQSDDTLWVVNESAGLNRVILDNKGSVLSSETVSMEDGLPQNSLHRIIDDGLGHFWISGNSGIMRISITELNSYADGNTSDLKVLSFNQKDGMINREANGGVQSSGILTSDGTLWFPNQRGITVIDPGTFSADQGLDVPSPVFESVDLAERKLIISGSDEIIIPDQERDVRVNFTVPNFVNQDRLTFSYLLEDVNKVWQDATQSRQAVFTGIPPGKHQLKLRSQFNSEDPAESSITIIIPPKFHETKGFMAVLLLGILGFIYAGFRIRLKSLKDSEKKLQERVKDQTKELERAAEEKQRFFTGITHELKTPLSLIIGPLDDIVQDPNKNSGKKLTSRLSMMQRNSYRLKNLVDQILDVTKLNADAITLKFQPVDLPQFTRQITGQFQSKLEQEELSVKVHGEEFDEYMYVDQEAWERIIINLMSNAIKFSPKKSTISLYFTDMDSTIELRVKDEGPGISAGDQTKIFEYLYQAEGDRAPEGTGIGLYLVKGLLEHMGGTISLNDQLESGTEFIVTLQKGHAHIGSAHQLLHEPLFGDEKVPLPKRETGTEKKDTERKQFDQNILVVEDNRDFSSYLKSILEEYYEVKVTHNGSEALKALGEQTPDLVISDIMMPEMNGLEFVNRLRSKKNLSHLPVIFLSAKAEDLDVQAGLSSGADVYLTKPIRSSMLLTQVFAMLRRESILANKSSTSGSKEEPELVRQVKDIIYRQLASPSLNVTQLADVLFMSRAKLYADWKKVSAISLNEVIKQTRMNEAKILLQEQGFSVQEAARAVGYTDANYFSTSFKKEFGLPPSEVR